MKSNPLVAPYHRLIPRTFYRSLLYPILALLLITVGACAGSAVETIVSDAESPNIRSAPATPTTRILSAVQAIEAETGGTIGLSVRHVNRPLELDHNADDVFPAASVIKLHLLTVLHLQAERGELSFDEVMVLTEGDKVGGSGQLQHGPDGSEYTLDELARLMIVVSDNVATNMLIRRAGGMGAVNTELRGLGFEQSRFGRLMMDVDARARGIENDITASETTEFLVALERRLVGAPETSRAVLDVLLKQELTDLMPALLPEGVRVGHKTGSLEGISHDAGIMYTPSGPIAVTILTRDIPDPAVSRDAIQRIARVIYDEWGANPDPIATGVAAIHERYGGRVAVSARHLTWGLSFDYHADQNFTIASVMKTPILVALYRHVERGEASLDEMIVMREEDIVPGSGRIQHDPPNSEYTLGELARLMIVISDNTATNLVIQRLGFDALAQEFAAMRLPNTRMSRRYYNAADGPPNLVNARSLARTYTLLEHREAANSELSDEMLEILLAVEDTTRIVSGVPSGTPVAHKSGWVRGVSHDAGIIYSPTGPIVLAILTENIPDPEDGLAVNREVARLVWKFWAEPDGE